MVASDANQHKGTHTRHKENVFYFYKKAEIGCPKIDLVAPQDETWHQMAPKHDPTTDQQKLSLSEGLKIDFFTILGPT